MSRASFAVVGAGAVGGYYAARLAAAGHDVAVVARGAHLEAIRTRGLWVWSPLGDLVVHPRASADPADLGPADVVLYAVKTYDNATALAHLPPLLHLLPNPMWKRRLPRCPRSLCPRSRS